MVWRCQQVLNPHFPFQGVPVSPPGPHTRVLFVLIWFCQQLSLAGPCPAPSFPARQLWPSSACGTKDWEHPGPFPALNTPVPFFLCYDESFPSTGSEAGIGYCQSPVVKSNIICTPRHCSWIHIFRDDIRQLCHWEMPNKLLVLFVVQMLYSLCFLGCSFSCWILVVPRHRALCLGSVGACFVGKSPDF